MNHLDIENEGLYINIVIGLIIPSLILLLNFLEQTIHESDQFIQTKELEQYLLKLFSHPYEHVSYLSIQCLEKINKRLAFDCIVKKFEDKSIENVIKLKYLYILKSSSLKNPLSFECIIETCCSILTRPYSIYDQIIDDNHHKIKALSYLSDKQILNNASSVLLLQLLVKKPIDLHNLNIDHLLKPIKKSELISWMNSDPQLKNYFTMGSLLIALEDEYEYVRLCTARTISFILMHVCSTITELGYLECLVQISINYIIHMLLYDPSDMVRHGILEFIISEKFSRHEQIHKALNQNNLWFTCIKALLNNRDKQTRCSAYHLITKFIMEPDQNTEELYQILLFNSKMHIDDDEFTNILVASRSLIAHCSNNIACIISIDIKESILQVIYSNSREELFKIISTINMLIHSKILDIPPFIARGYVLLYWIYPGSLDPIPEDQLYLKQLLDPMGLLQI